MLKSAAVAGWFNDFAVVEQKEQTEVYTARNSNHRASSKSKRINRQPRQWVNLTHYRSLITADSLEQKC
jgi:hypothetical protein